MEKCSYCSQRIQEVKIAADKETRYSRWGDPDACQQSCPTDAIIFGNINDKDSRVAKIKTQERTYGVLADIKHTAAHNVCGGRAEHQRRAGAGFGRVQQLAGSLQAAGCSERATGGRQQATGSLKRAKRDDGDERRTRQQSDGGSGHRRVPGYRAGTHV